MIFLPKCSAAMAALTSNEAARFALTALRLIELEGDDGTPCFRLEATDGRVAGILRGPGPQPKGSFQPFENDDPACEGLIGEKEFSLAMKPVAKDGHLCVGMQESGAYLSSAAAMTFAPKQEGRFPSIASVL